MKEEKGREERVVKLFRIEEKISGFSLFIFFFLVLFFGGYGRF